MTPEPADATIRPIQESPTSANAATPTGITHRPLGRRRHATAAGTRITSWAANVTSDASGVMLAVPQSMTSQTNVALMFTTTSVGNLCAKCVRCARARSAVDASKSAVFGMDALTGGALTGGAL